MLLTVALERLLRLCSFLLVRTITIFFPQVVEFSNWPGASCTEMDEMDR